MKKQFTVIVSILIFLAVFIPLASNSPDGLERVVENLRVEEHASVWNGIMSDYAIVAIKDTYLSTSLAGIFGTLMVLVAGFLLGKSITPKEPKISE